MAANFDAIQRILLINFHLLVWLLLSGNGKWACRIVHGNHWYIEGRERNQCKWTGRSHFCERSLAISTTVAEAYPFYFTEYLAEEKWQRQKEQLCHGSQISHVHLKAYIQCNQSNLQVQLPFLGSHAAAILHCQWLEQDENCTPFLTITLDGMLRDNTWAHVLP